MFFVPKISVVICTCNGEKWIHKQLQSIMAQSLPVHEIIVHDDISDDDTYSILENYAGQYPRLIRLSQSRQRLGAAENFRQAILKTTGDYIFLSDQDDEWLPEKVEILMDLFAQNRWAEAIATDAWLMDKEGGRLSSSFWSTMDFEPQSVPGGRFGLASFLLSRGNVCCGATMAFRKARVEEMLKHPIPPEVLHDYWIALYMAMQNAMLLSSEKCMSYRVHADQALGVPRLFYPSARNNQLLRQDLLIDCTAIAFGISRLQRLQGSLIDSDEMEYQVMKTYAHLQAMLTAAKTIYFRTFALIPRKWKMLKHLLKGGEYLRVSFRDLIRI